MPSSNAVLRRWLAAAAAGAVLVIAPHGIAASHPAAAGTVTVKVKVTGQSRGAVAGTHPEDGKDQIPARNACTRFTAPKFAVPGRPLAYNVSFGNPDVLNFRPGIFFAFYYDPKQVGRPQKLYTRGGGANLLLVVARNEGFAVAQPGWAGTVTLGGDLRSGSFSITGARGIIGNAKVTVTGSWRCSSVFARAT